MIKSVDSILLWYDHLCFDNHEPDTNVLRFGFFRMLITYATKNQQNKVRKQIKESSFW